MAMPSQDSDLTQWRRRARLRACSLACSLGGDANYGRRFDVMCMVDWVDGKIDRKEFVAKVMQYARL